MDVDQRFTLTVGPSFTKASEANWILWRSVEGFIPQEVLEAGRVPLQDESWATLALVLHEVMNSVEINLQQGMIF